MSSKIFYCTKVVAYGILCIITKLEFFQHQFTKMGHRNTSCDPHLHPSHQATNAPLPHAKRPPPGGYVLTTLPAKSCYNPVMRIAMLSLTRRNRKAFEVVLTVIFILAAGTFLGQERSAR